MKNSRPRFPPLLAATVLAGIVFVVPGPAPAQDEAERWPPQFRDTTEVRVVNVDVTVTDRGGRPVGGLGREAFELFVDGKPVEISNFYAVENGQVVAFAPSGGEAPVDEETADEVAAAPRQLHVIVFVDNAHLRDVNRRRSFAALEGFIGRERHDEVRMMLVSYDRPSNAEERALVVRQRFTTDPVPILAALEELEGLAIGGDRFDAQQRQLVEAFERINIGDGNRFTFDENGEEEEDSYRRRRMVESQVLSLGPQIQVFAQDRFEDVQQTLATLRQLVDIAAGLPGRKALIHVSDGIPLRSGEMFFEAFERRFASLHTTTQNLIGGMDSHRFDSSTDLETLVARASAANVTFYPLDATTINASQLGAEASSTSRFFDGSLATIADENRREPLIMMAESTGGRAGLSPSALGATLDGIFNDYDNHYSLGFTLDPDAPDKARDQWNVTVKVRGPRLRVRSRRYLREENPAERIAQQVLATLMTEHTENPLDITLVTEAATPVDDGTFVVPLRVRVPLAELVLLPGKNEHQARVSLWVAVRDERGRFSRVVQHACPIAVKNSEVLVALGRSMDCGVRLRMRGGRQDIAVAVQDEVSRTVATARLAVDVPGAAEQAARPRAGAAGSGR